MTLRALAQRIERLAPPRDIIAIRDAHDRAERIATAGEAERVLERAIRTNDTSLAYAVLHEAAARHWVELPEKTVNVLESNMQLTDGTTVETTADRIRRIAGENAAPRPSMKELRRATTQLVRERRQQNPQEKPGHTGLVNKGRDLFRERASRRIRNEDEQAREIETDQSLSNQASKGSGPATETRVPSLLPGRRPGELDATEVLSRHAKAAWE